MGGRKSPAISTSGCVSLRNSSHCATVAFLRIIGTLAHSARGSGWCDRKRFRRNLTPVRTEDLAGYPRVFRVGAPWPRQGLAVRTDQAASAMRAVSRCSEAGSVRRVSPQVGPRLLVELNSVSMAHRFRQMASASWAVRLVATVTRLPPLGSRAAKGRGRDMPPGMAVQRLQRVLCVIRVGKLHPATVRAGGKAVVGDPDGKGNITVFPPVEPVLADEHPIRQEHRDARPAEEGGNPGSLQRTLLWRASVRRKATGHRSAQVWVVSCGIWQGFRGMRECPRRTRPTVIAGDAGPRGGACGHAPFGFGGKIGYRPPCRMIAAQY